MIQGGGLPAAFAAEMGQRLGPDFPPTLALAVSGGGDSMALLHLAAGWARPMGIALRVVTVDHGLRPDSGAEAAMVADECAILNLPHTTLRWQGWDGTGNIQDQARQARYALMGDWLGDCTHLVTAHTQDDQAETLLMRLTRGSGVEGLAAMAPLSQRPKGWWLLRPLLDVPRADLRHYAQTLRIPFVDDPSNDDPRFDRIRVRQALDGLADLGLTRATLAETATRMARARTALQARMDSVAGDVVQAAEYEVILSRDALTGIERDTQLRLLAAALQWISSTPYRPRAAALDALLDRLLSGGDGTLQGCHLITRQDRIWIAREGQALIGQTAPGHSRWDHRWQVGALPDGHHVAALGEGGARQLPERPENVPYPCLLATPAVFEGPRLVACPRAGFGPPVDLSLAVSPPFAPQGAQRG